MNFLNIEMLWHLLWILPLLLIAALTASRRRQRFLRQILGDRASQSDFVLLSPGIRKLRMLLLFGAVFCLALAAARPYWGLQIIPYANKGRDLMVLFDVSRSMLSQDVQPSRLEHAKWFVRQLVSECPGDRFGLIAFAGTAYLECPLTSDKTTFFQYLDDLKTDTVPIGGTNIQKALEVAADAFKAAESGHRAIILVTDGDELEGDSKAELNRFRQLKTPLFVVGVGDPLKPGLIPVPNSTGQGTEFLKDASGEPVKSKLNEKQLQLLATSTNGCYARTTSANSNIDNVLKRIRGLVPDQLKEGKQTTPIERFYYPLALGLALLLIWFSLSERNGRGRSRSSAVALLLIAGLFGLPGNLRADDNLLPGGKTTEQSAPDSQPVTPAVVKKNGTIPDPTTLYNQARNLQKTKPEEATALYRQVINSAIGNPGLQADSYQNLGVISHEQARNVVKQGLSTLKSENLDGALKSLDQAKDILKQAEDLYADAFSLAPAVPTPAPKPTTATPQPQKNTATEQPQTQPISSLVMNQQKLLLDRKMIEEMKKKIEELKKKQQQAQQQTKQAQQQQQQANQQKQNQQDKQQQDKQQQDKQQQDKQQQDKQQQNQQNKQQQDKQQQNQQDKQQQSQSQQQKADQQRQQAEQQVKDLRDAAREMDQKKLEKQAEEALKDIKQADRDVKQNRKEDAEKNLQKAVEKLSPPENDQKDQKDQKDKQGQSQQQNDKKEDKGKQDQKPSDKTQQDKQLPSKQQKQQQGSAAKAEKEKDIDKNQAAAILDAMANDEKTLRDAIKQSRRQQYRNRQVEKDW